MPAPSLRRSVLALAGRALIFAALTLVLLEVSLRVVERVRFRAPGLRYIGELSRGLVNYGECDELVWKSRFIAVREALKVDFALAGLNVPHGTRGWTPKPNYRGSNLRGRRYSINGAGLRSLSEYQADPHKYAVLILGDSFTFGFDADDSDVWPNMLQALDDRLNVINLGVGGYGIDQMYITLREEITRYEPNLVVAAFVGADLLRSMVGFRDFKKPKFELQGEQLVLTNTPIGSPEEVYREVKSEIGEVPGRPSAIRMIQVLKNLYRGVRIKPKCDYEYRALNRRLFEEMMRCAADANAEFVLVYLPYEREIWDPSYRSTGEEFFNWFVRQHPVKNLNTRPRFLEKPGAYARVGHYQGAEAALVSRLVYERIQELASWRRFVERPSRGERAPRG